MIPIIYKKIIKIFILVSVILILAIIFFASGKATIQVTAKSQPRDINFATPVSSSGENNSLKGRLLQVNLEKTKKFTVPFTEISDKKAGGEVTVYNKYSKNQTLIATTRLQSPDGLIFRINNTVNVPAGGSIKVQVLADQEGDNYLIDPSKFTIPGLNASLQPLIYAESNAKMDYHKQTKYQLTTKEYAKDKEGLITDLEKDALADFKTQLQGDEIIKDDAIAVEILEEKSTAKINDEVKDFELTLKVQVKTLAFSETQLKDKVTAELTASLTEGDKIEYLNPEMSLNIELHPEEKENIAVITGQYQVKIVNNNINLDEIKGLSKADAETKLNEQPNFENAQVNLWPFWITKVPDNEKKIEVIIN